MLVLHGTRRLRQIRVIASAGLHDKDFVVVLYERRVGDRASIRRPVRAPSTGEAPVGTCFWVQEIEVVLDATLVALKEDSTAIRRRDRSLGVEADSSGQNPLAGAVRADEVDLRVLPVVSGTSRQLLKGDCLSVGRPSG